MQQNPRYENLISEIYDFFEEQITKASKFDIKKIFVDPGIGFGKTISHNYEIIERLCEFKSLGFLILIGASRKSFLGNSLNLKINEREEATLITESFAVIKGAKIIRTHNVKNAVKLKNIYNNMKFNSQNV
jgi:dihydropteroate synthase